MYLKQDELKKCLREDERCYNPYYLMLQHNIKIVFIHWSKKVHQPFTGQSQVAVLI